LNSVRKLESEGRSQSRSAFRNVEVKRDRLPRFEDRVVTPRERVISCLQWPAQHFGDGDGRGREAQVPCSMGFEGRLEARPEFRVPLQEVDDGCRIDEKERILLAGHRPGSRGLRGNVGGLLAGGRESLKNTARWHSIRCSPKGESFNTKLSPIFSRISL
jgi:hypothetical protein